MGRSTAEAQIAVQQFGATTPPILRRDAAPGYMIRDRDRIYGTVITRRLRAMGIRDKPITPASPWQNGFVERLIGSIRRECVDHIIVLGEAHLRRILKSYARYYNETRTHLALDKDAPVFRPVQRTGVVRSRAILGGLHHHYAQAQVFGKHSDWLRVRTARDNHCRGERQNLFAVLIVDRPSDARGALRLCPRWCEFDHLTLDPKDVTGANWSQPAQIVDGETQQRMRPERM